MQGSNEDFDPNLDHRSLRVSVNGQVTVVNGFFALQ